MQRMVTVVLISKRTSESRTRVRFYILKRYTVYPKANSKPVNCKQIQIPENPV